MAARTIGNGRPGARGRGRGTHLPHWAAGPDARAARAAGHTAPARLPEPDLQPYRAGGLRPLVSSHPSAHVSTTVPCRSAGRCARRAARGLAFFGLAAAAVGAQQWSMLDGAAVAEGNAAYDARRQRLVVFGPGGVFEFDGDRRLPRAIGPAVPAPLPREGAAMAYDPVRGHVLLFGGLGVNALGDTWTWDGLGWRQPFSTLTPPRRSGAAMTFDAARGRLLMFGGTANGQALADTWEHDGREWTPRSPPTQPGHLAVAKRHLVFDPGRGVSLLLLSDAGGRTEVWEWDGVDWRAAAAATVLPAPQSCAFDPVRGRLVVLGQGAVAGAIWEWDGAVWSAGPATTQLPRFGGFLWFDPQRAAVVAMGGWNRDSAAVAWDGTALLPLHGDLAPPARLGAVWVADPDAGRALVFGGRGADAAARGDTWTWDGTDWQRPAPAIAPPPRQSAAAAWDGARGAVLVFGGLSGLTPLGDFWAWSNGSWSAIAANGPPARSGAAMVADPVRGEVLLFGGRSGLALTAMADLWSWDGAVWTQRFPVLLPSARHAARTAFDAARGRAILAGGEGPGGLLLDAFAWDGSTFAPLPAPPLAAGAEITGLAWDEAAQRTSLLAHGDNGMVDVLEHLQFDGAAWQLVDRTAWRGGSLRGSAQLAFDGRRDRLVLYDGGVVAEWTSVPAAAAPYGTGCGAPAPFLAARVRPRIGEARFGLELLAAPGRAALIAVAADRAGTPVGGCTLEIGPALASALWITDARGRVLQPVPLPLDPALRGLTVFAQAGVLDAGGLGLSRGLSITAGD